MKFPLDLHGFWVPLIELDGFTMVNMRKFELNTWYGCIQWVDNLALLKSVVVLWLPLHLSMEVHKLFYMVRHGAG